MFYIDYQLSFENLSSIICSNECYKGERKIEVVSRGESA